MPLLKIFPMPRCQKKIDAQIQEWNAKFKKWRESLMKKPKILKTKINYE